jgi:hypothetical protein
VSTFPLAGSDPLLREFEATGIKTSSGAAGIAEILITAGWD